MAVAVVDEGEGDASTEVAVIVNDEAAEISARH